MNQWKESKRLLGGFNCLEHQVTGELALVGRYGEIWQEDAFTYKAIIYSNRIARRYLPKEQRPELPGDESLIRIPARDLPFWLRRLAIPVKSKSQAEFAALAKSNMEEPSQENLSLEPKVESKNKMEAEPTPTDKSLNLDPGDENIDDENENVGGGG